MVGLIAGFDELLGGVSHLGVLPRSLGCLLSEEFGLDAELFLAAVVAEWSYNMGIQTSVASAKVS